MYQIIHIFILVVMAAVAVIAPAAALAQEEGQSREVIHARFEMRGDFSREGRYFVSRPPHGADDYFKIMPGDNVTIEAIRFEDGGQWILLDDWLMRISVNSSDAKHDNGDSKKVKATGEVRFEIDESEFEGRLNILDATCLSVRQPAEGGLFEGCYKYELRGTLRFVEVPADAAQG